MSQDLVRVPLAFTEEPKVDRAGGTFQARAMSPDAVQASISAGLMPVLPLQGTQNTPCGRQGRLFAG